ncbi:HpcH/HpaI aldolase/citrate lyase family protein [Janthinobacterium sp. NFX145]|uniref:HpcH/HpaI aldolase/citrate lyase family protein n=1 Tax=Janthinobacterium sp. NFX145 TaxID=3415602 RepID=UPI003CC6DB34
MTAAALRCMLFVPGNRPERFAKGIASGVDAIIIDLEDAVPLAEKDGARSTVMAYLAAPREGRVALGVRINALGTAAGLRDLLALGDSGAVPDFVMLAKVGDAAEVRQAAALTDARTGLVALIESPGGLARVESIATAHPRLRALMFGGGDFAAESRAQFSWEPLLYGRQRLAAAAAAAGIEAIDVPFLDLQDVAGLEAETRRVLALGYTCKAAIHPSQVAPVQQCFAADQATLERARRIVAAALEHGDGAFSFEGRMVDRPIVQAMQRIVAFGALAGGRQ